MSTLTAKSAPHCFVIIYAISYNQNLSAKDNWVYVHRRALGFFSIYY